MNTNGHVIHHFPWFLLFAKLFFYYLPDLLLFPVVSLKHGDWLGAWVLWQWLQFQGEKRIGGVSFGDLRKCMNPENPPVHTIADTSSYCHTRAEAVRKESRKERKPCQAAAWWGWHFRKPEGENKEPGTDMCFHLPGTQEGPSALEGSWGGNEETLSLWRAGITYKPPKRGPQVKSWLFCCRLYTLKMQVWFQPKWNVWPAQIGHFYTWFTCWWTIFLLFDLHIDLKNLTKCLKIGRFRDSLGFQLH